MHNILIKNSGDYEMRAVDTESASGLIECIEEYMGCIRYEYGRKIDDFPENILCKKVTFATANGAWSRMDYLLVIE